MKTALILACAALSACSPRVVTKARPVTVKVPVTVPCAAKRPDKPLPLPDGNTWTAMDVRQKAAAVGAKAIEWRNYGEQLEAATGGCR